MKTSARSGQAAFTLVELMTVVTIIIILAALVVNSMGFVSDRQAKEKAKIQMALISKSLEEYKLDTGNYPLTVNTTSGSNQSDVLFNALYFEGSASAAGSAAGTTTAKVYLNELNPSTTKQGWTTGAASAKTKIKDPWGNEYRYRSAAGVSGANTNTQNPDFDLWSTGKDGKTEPGTPKDPKNNDDIKSP
jgi:type II secretory pathway pseudopilin PulG